MNTTKIALFAGVAIVVAGGLVVALKMNPSSTGDTAGTIAAPVKNVEIAAASPFTNLATIPASVDPSSIRFEKLKAVEVASKMKTTTDEQRCKDLKAKDPDGSGCSSTAVVEKVKAIEATYSYDGVELGAGEGGAPGRTTFSVYFRPEDVVVDGPVAKLKRDQAAGMFRVTSYRAMVDQKVVDKQHSQFCAGSYIDGSFVRTDPKCQDQVQFTTQSVASPYLTVQVDLVNPVATK